jgi:pimeloyl-ACP methyl ester carboxylesterase
LVIPTGEDALPSHTAHRTGQSLTEQSITLKDGRTLGFAEYGDLNGKPVIECHGWPSSRLQASNYDEAGNRVGARVIGIDRPGMGISTFKKGFRVADWPSDVIELANALSLERFAVAAISSGSPYGFACARFIPERITSCAIVGGIPPLKVEGETLRPEQYMEATELKIMRLANSLPLISRAGFWFSRVVS